MKKALYIILGLAVWVPILHALPDVNSSDTKSQTETHQTKIPETACEWAEYELDHALGKSPDEIRMITFRVDVACGNLPKMINEELDRRGDTTTPRLPVQ